MTRGIRVFSLAVATLWVVACLLSVAAFAQPAANEVLQWNETTMKAIAENGQNNVVATRTLAMVQAAVHDALNAIDRRYDAYYFEDPPTPQPRPMPRWLRPLTPCSSGSSIASALPAEGRRARRGRAGVRVVARPRYRRSRPEQRRGRRTRDGRGDAHPPQG